MPYTPTWNNPYMQPQFQQFQQSVPSMNSPQPYQQPVNGVIRVNGRESALQYQLPPNSQSPALFDNSGLCFYIVSTDGTGMKTVETFDFKPHEEEPQQPTVVGDYASRKELEELSIRVNTIMEMVNNGLHAAVQPSVPAQAVDGNAPVTPKRGRPRNAASSGTE